MSKYYLPKIEEFKQGFKYQVCYYLKGEKIGSWGFMNYEQPVEFTPVYNQEEEWIDTEVWWDRPPEVKTTKYADITWTWTELPEMDLLPNYEKVKIYLENGKIRAGK